MPINGSADPPAYEPLYFKSLKDLDEWIPGRNAKRYEGIIKYTPRKPHANAQDRGRLLVCHDYKGGYVESLLARSYTFNYWSLCDIFIYFSHHRVTVPPPGWVSAAHKQGVKMLGTLIFEPGAGEDSLRLTLGKFPTSRTGRVVPPSVRNTMLPLSPHYAKVLAELARERGFDGYLLNFECLLMGGLEHTRTVAAWITMLQSELRAKVGPHAETIWYDSVIVNGKVAWQDRLNSYNLPFFLPATGFFTNYTWRNHIPTRIVKYFNSLSNNLLSNTPESHVHAAPKTIQDIYMGIDVWGRGCHGGGGFGSYKAMQHVGVNIHKLSIALFGQAWTWESEQDKEGWTWDKWWDFETKFWVGPNGASVPIPEDPPLKPGEQPCTHGRYMAISSFVLYNPPPDPSDAPFSTSFCPGTGLAWFVEGLKVYQSANGWTDMDKQTSKGDLLWPSPKLYWNDERKDKIPTATAAFCFEEAWNGGNSMKISVSLQGSDDELAAYRPLWLPVQPLHLTPNKIYEATIVYKVDSSSTAALDLEIALGFKPATQLDTNFVMNVISSWTLELASGWTKLGVQFNTTSKSEEIPCPTQIAAGLIVAIVAEEPTQPAQLSLLLDQLNVFPHVPPPYKEEDPFIVWAELSSESSSAETNSTLTGTLTWEVAVGLPRATMDKQTPEDPRPTWNGQPTIDWFPSFLYFNIYAQLFAADFTIGPVEKAVWVGTSGWDGQKNGFNICPTTLPFGVPQGRKVRFYIQGVTDRGEVLKWDKCAFVDVN